IHIAGFYDLSNRFRGAQASLYLGQSNLNHTCQLRISYTRLESKGQVLPTNAWTLHGLWPGFWNGSYTQYSHMNKFWTAQAQPNPDFWAHEFSKHATCFSNFVLPCYSPANQNHSEVVDYFETAYLLYIGYSGPRYNATAAGSGTMYNGRTVLSEVWYFFHVYGRVQEVLRGPG
ncbi:unnamed protein product, partial [Diplocarpon coronariae]